MFRRAGDFVNKILRGIKPADLPVEQPVKFDLMINATTAKVLGLTIPEKIWFVPVKFSDVVQVRRHRQFSI